MSASSKRTNCHVQHEDPRLEPADLFRGHSVPRGCPADLLLGAPWVHFVSEEVDQEVSLREPGEPLCMCQEVTICRTKPLPPATIPLTKYQNCSSQSGACVDLWMPLCSSTYQGAPCSHNWEDQTQPSCLKFYKKMIIESAGRRTCE